MTEIDASSLTPLEASIAARRQWLSATSQSDLDEVERLYRWALSSKSTQDDDDDDDDGPTKKKRKRSGNCGLSRSDYIQTGEKLALLLCQSGRSKKAKKGLAAMGFTCRLSRQVLDYPTTEVQSDGSTEEDKPPPCQIIDGFLTTMEVERLQSVFESPTASYWTLHNYAVEPPSPYFSYVIQLSEIDNTDKFGFIGNLIQKVMMCPLLNAKFNKLQKTRYVEMWAHNRPHPSGHQMHFDSGEELVLQPCMFR
jgi:hypothetical protein